MNENVLEIHNLVYSFDKRLLFNNVNFNIKSNSITAVVGSNNSGKSTLIKILGANYFTENMIKSGKIVLNKNTINAYKKKVTFIDFQKFQFTSDSVYKELFEELSFTRWSEDKKDSIINKVLNNLLFSEYCNSNPSRLSKKNKINLLLAKALILNPKVLIMELCDLNLNNSDKDYIFKTLKQYLPKGASIVYCTNNSEDILYSDRIVVLHNGNVAIEGVTSLVLTKDSLLLKLGIELPFIVDLSLKLKFYEIINKIYLTEEDLVSSLWK
ncbi:MAG: ATP-binding cassette domain-containing protein [Bacilli bacterium]